MFYSFICFLFYIWAILAILFEIWMIYPSSYKKLLSYNEKTKLENKSKQKTTIEGVKKDLASGKLNGAECAFSLLVLGYFVWDTLGLFSSQWLFFLGIWVLSIIGMGIRALKLSSYAWNLTDSLLTLVCLFGIIINKYHTHVPNPKLWIDLVKWVKHLF